MVFPIFTSQPMPSLESSHRSSGHALITHLSSESGFVAQQELRSGEPEAAYRAFLFRVWRRTLSGETRASLTDVDTGAIQAFADLDALHEWLESTIRTFPATQEETDTTRGRTGLAPTTDVSR